MTTPNQPIVPTHKLVLCNIGEDGVGKTVCGLSISKQYPVTIPAPKPVTITDTFWGCADLHALTSARKCGLNVAEYFDIPTFLANKEAWKAEKVTAETDGAFVGKCRYTEAVRVMLNKMAAWLKVHPGGNLGLDTLSSISAGLFSEYAREAAYETGQHFSLRMPENMRNVYGQLLSAMELLSDYLMSMDFGILILLLHTRALVDMVDRDVKQQKAIRDTRKAGKALEDATIIPDASGNGIKFFKHHIIMQLPIKATRAPGARTRARYFLTNPANSESMECKNKFEGVLSDREPAHWLKVLAKINASKV